MKTFFDILGVVLGCVCALCLIASTAIGNPTLLLTSVGSYCNDWLLYNFKSI